jgi:hypothetical protein
MTSIATTVPAPLSVAPVPAIHESRWPSDHHHFIFQLGIGAGNLGDRIEAMLMVTKKLRSRYSFQC